MQILSNCISNKVDEGCLKIANSLVKRIKKAGCEATVISYERKGELTDEFLELNKFLLNRKLFKILKKDKDRLLYIPFPSKPLSSAIRIFSLSLFSRKKPDVLLVMRINFSGISRLILKLSGAKIAVLSKRSYNFYNEFLDEKNLKLWRCGVDTNKFVPVSHDKKSELRTKYGFDNRPIVLHIGHLNEGRGVGELLKISKEYNVLLVTSTLTKNEQDTDLKNKLLKAPNVKILEDYIENIEEIYQLSDVYLFPTRQAGNCIDVPLSCFEAAACNIPVITTDYGEMRELKGSEDFYFINEVKENEINSLIAKILEKKEYNSRQAALDYDFEACVERIIK